jgi:hypothetical protein
MSDAEHGASTGSFILTLMINHMRILVLNLHKVVRGSEKTKVARFPQAEIRNDLERAGRPSMPPQTGGRGLFLCQSNATGYLTFGFCGFKEPLVLIENWSFKKLRAHSNQSASVHQKQLMPIPDSLLIRLIPSIIIKPFLPPLLFASPVCSRICAFPLLSTVPQSPQIIGRRPTFLPASCRLRPSQC